MMFIDEIRDNLSSKDSANNVRDGLGSELAEKVTSRNARVFLGLDR